MPRPTAYESDLSDSGTAPYDADFNEIDLDDFAPRPRRRAARATSSRTTERTGARSTARASRRLPSPGLSIDEWGDEASPEFLDAAAAPVRSGPSRRQTTRDLAARDAMLRDAARRTISEFDDEYGDDFEAPAPRRSRARTSTAKASTTRKLPREVTPANPTREDKKEKGKRTAAKTTDKSVPRTPPRAIVYEITGVVLVAAGILLFLNARLPAEAIRGTLTSLAVGIMHWLFGIGAIAMALLMMALGAILIVKRHRTNVRAFWRGSLTGFLALLTASHLAVPHHFEFAGQSVLWDHGGYVGGALAFLLRAAVGEIGAYIVLTALALIALLLWTEISLGEIVNRTAAFLGMGARRAGRQARDASRATREGFRTYYGDFADYDNYEDAERSLQLQLREIQEKNNVTREKPASRPLRRGNTVKNPADALLQVDEMLTDLPHFGRDSSPLRDSGPLKDEGPVTIVETPAPPAETETVDPMAPRIEFTDAPPPESVVADVPPQPETAPETNETAEIKVDNGQQILEVNANLEEELTPTEALEAQALATATGGTVSDLPVKVRPEVIRRRFGEGPLMPPYFDDAVRALDPPVVPDLAGADEDVQAGVAAVQETLASFKIDARVTDVKRGPVITRYEVQPAAGVRVASIANLDRDMARSLSAIAVRIEAPVPGKNVVGIEVPNKKVHLVRLRDVLERHEFLSAPSKLSFVLGKDIAGQPKWGDLTKMPHMLIAGSTNSGKSVCLNSIIASILVRATPDEVKFSLIDPKRVELTLFKDIRHLYHPVVVEPKDAVRALRGMIAEMDRRYKRFAERGVRNIVSYNSKLEEGEPPLPYIVIVIDELADLMMTAAAEFEKLICRIAQLARATGIHLIVATQRPSVNVITGVIKANIPSRVAFAVASQVDSRTILDSVGAERLIGSGDMLYDPNNGGKAVRIQGAYLSEEEVNRIVDVVKDYYSHDDSPMEYGMDLTSMDDDDEEITEERPSRDQKRDELYDEILDYVVRNQEMSASMIQRKFEIGYPRAARIVDQFERDGVLSAANGSKARKVIGNGRGKAIED